MERSGKKILSLALGVLALSLTAGAVRAEEGDGDKPKIEKRRVVVINEDGKQRVIEGDAMSAKRGFLGVGLTDLSPELRKHFGAPEDAGVMVSHVEDGSPAEKAGIRVGDIVTSVDGDVVDSSFEVSSRIRKLTDGQQAAFEVYRDGRSQKLTAVMAERERPAIDMGPLFFKEMDGDHMFFRMDKDKLLHGKGDGKKLMWTESEDGDGPHVFTRKVGSPREAALEKQLRDLEKRIAELEKALAKKN
jgi:membrane-associated protease RseP (regulator of RpoE activity)